MRPVPAYGIRCFRLIHGVPVSLNCHCSLASRIRLLAKSHFLLLERRQESVAIVSYFENPQKGQVILDCNSMEFMAT